MGTRGSLKDGNGWTTIRRKQFAAKPPPNLAHKTIFINFLPPDVDPQLIINIFSRHGDIADLVIPFKKRVNCDHHFAFLKFFSTQAFLNAIKRENGRKLGRHTLRVNPAKFDTPSRQPNPNQKPFKPPIKTPSLTH